MLKLSLNQTGVSLDFGTILEKGAYRTHLTLPLLVAPIDELDARTLGSLLLQDLWTAAKIRGKGESGQKRSFRVFVDEFSRFLTPTMAEGLAEARGFALEFFLSCQSTTQLRATPAGQQVLDAVLANAHTKIVFNVQHPDDLETLTPWLYRNEVDPDQIKHQHYASRVLGHKIEYMESTSSSKTRGAADASNWSTTESASSSSSISHTHSDSTGISASVQQSHSAGKNAALSAGSSHSQAESSAESTAEGMTESQAAGQTRQQSSQESEGRHLDGNYDDMMKIVGDKKKRIATFDQVYTDNKDEDYRSFNRTIDQTASESDTQSKSESTGIAKTQSVSRATAKQKGESQSQAMSLGTSEATNEGQTRSVSFQSSDSETQSESTAVGTARTVGGGRTDSQSKSEGVIRAPMLVPILDKEALPPAFRSTDEQLFIYSQQLSSQPDRHAVVRIGIDPPVGIFTPVIEAAQISAKGVNAWATLKLKRLPFVLTFEDATRRLLERQRHLEQKYLGTNSTGEPTTTARRIKE